VALCQARISTKPLWGFSSSNPYHSQSRAEQKVLTKEKKAGLKVVAFDRSSFKMFTLRFSNKSVQAASCERPRTAPRTLFLSFANNNCFQIEVLRRSCMKKQKIREACAPRGEFKHRCWFFVDAPNIARNCSVI
jgi:hypothetical protein